MRSNYILLQIEFVGSIILCCNDVNFVFMVYRIGGREFLLPVGIVLKVTLILFYSNVVMYFRITLYYLHRCYKVFCTSGGIAFIGSLFASSTFRYS